MLLESVVDLCPPLLEIRAVDSWEGCWGLALSYKVRLSWCARRVEVTDILSDRRGYDDCREEERTLIVLSSGGAVRWIFFAGNISRVEVDALLFREGMDMLEDLICGSVPAPAFPPAFDDASVVSKDFDVRASGRGRDKREDEKPETNCFSPTNVSAVLFPPWQESPGPPPASDCDPNTNFRASI